MRTRLIQSTKGGHAVLAFYATIFTENARFRSLVRCSTPLDRLRDVAVLQPRRHAVPSVTHSSAVGAAPLDCAPACARPHGTGFWGGSWCTMSDGGGECAQSDTDIFDPALLARADGHHLLSRLPRARAWSQAVSRTCIKPPRLNQTQLP